MGQGWGFGEREGDPDGPWDQGKGWEKKSQRWRCLFPFMAETIGLWAAPRAREGLGFPERRGFVPRPDAWLYYGKPQFISPQLILGATLWSHKAFLGVRSATSFTAAP